VTGTRPGEVIATIRSLLPSLLPTEQAVATVLLARSADIVELSAQQVADLAGASRATVVRTCQSLGYTGYQQLRVLLARDAGLVGSGATATAPAPTDAAGIVTGAFHAVAASVDAMVALLDRDAITTAVETLATARRLVVVGNGLSAPLAQDAAARLVSIGRPAEAPLDLIGQQIAARLLEPGDALLAISGSGSNAATVASARAATAAGAPVVALTAFSRSPLTATSDVHLVVTAPELTFQEELTLASRLPHAILVEGLVAAVTRRLGDAALAARALALDVISENLAD
jgi:RpiR family transcriptional regulator, carbohydrate utilization regulator